MLLKVPATTSFIWFILLGPATFLICRRLRRLYSFSLRNESPLSTSSRMTLDSSIQVPIFGRGLASKSFLLVSSDISLGLTGLAFCESNLRGGRSSISIPTPSDISSSALTYVIRLDFLAMGSSVSCLSCCNSAESDFSIAYYELAYCRSSIFCFGVFIRFWDCLRMLKMSRP